ncbi:MAG: hypothetical protein A3H97_16235 [Acidobacteria bacterium RIFCSPLOWO2_02_FULL_65_29]|nr:MAG: hypothetical protein A3H97_16235 [Acidobacteria bacterium RIFCSPLOWO2_02_FULL_65_29]
MSEDPEGPTRECPLCGGTMRVKTTETVVLVPGNPKGTAKTSREWLCPDCDYFEEVDEDLDGG